MKQYLKFVSMALLCCYLAYAMPAFAQMEPGKRLELPQVEIKPLKSAVLSADVVARKFANLHKTDDEIKSLDAHLKNKGFLLQKGKKNFWGAKSTYQKDNKIVTHEVHLQDYTKANSKDVAAVGQVTVTAGDRSEKYTFYLFAPDGNLEAMEEFQIDKKLNILKANSWWSCVKSYISKKCGSACLNALTECLPGASTVVGYVACVAYKCGGCALKSLACCACDCSWWCKWAVGCCDR